jgi:hypothetical protein
MVFRSAVVICALVLAGLGCRSPKPTIDGPTPVPSADTLVLPLAAYLLALDSSVQHVRPYATRILVLMADTAVQIPEHELRARGLLPTRSVAVCGSDAVLSFQPPTRALLPGAIALHVDELTSHRGLVGGYAYIFDCAGDTCRLNDVLPSDRDVSVGCPQH